ncbi:hypothetical protein CH373_04360 [Leptospira perolatii]|uniref:Lipoprotein n=1 Tax=Leptospira perolatii TaxID=2023191 RepID=A0A2M9ZQ55_9LEPT|nr:hypothetical protein [Leptospira perolatii]PJZ68977.1 hypothetical protein CH360_12970 [Leptospira perolatii]PJZ74155.1 hypothetical protein CH373_04360 [Leptospira perolatii]
MKRGTYFHSALFPFLGAWIVSLGVSCHYSTEKRYTFAQPIDPDLEYSFNPDDPQFEEGEPYTVVDAFGNAFGVFAKAIIGDKRMENHRISDETKQFLKDYIRENNLKDVKVRFNQYAPWGDLKRLWRMKNINFLAKWTIGLISTLINEVILPGRIFGGDHYNPYTNTIHVYTDIPAVVVHEGGHAKDFAQREYKTGYSLLYQIPFIGTLYPEARASDDAVRYFRYRCDRAAELKSYRTLFPAYGTYVGGSVPGAEVVGAFFAIPGHIIGSTRANEFLREETPKECEIAEELEKEKAKSETKRTKNR